MPKIKQSSKQLGITDELKAKCDAPNQFDNFDRLFRAVISVPKTTIDKEEAKWKATRRKKKKKAA